MENISNAKASIEAIRLRGARQNNLQGIDIDLPVGRLIVVTGLSGAGKSSLVFDTLHAEGQRRYVETFSPYTRQFMERLDRPKLDSVENIRPSIAIEQGNTVKTSRSTVGTMTELCDFFKVWFQRRARLYDPANGEPLDEDNPQSLTRKILARRARQTLCIAFETRRPASLPWEEILSTLRSQGFARVILGAKEPQQAESSRFARTDELDAAALEGLDSIHVVQDRMEILPENADRLSDAVATALRYGHGELALFDDDGRYLARRYEGLRSPVNGRRFRRATPALFSFNNPLGACPKCRGFGRVIEIDYRLVIPDHSKTLEEGAIAAFSGAIYGESQRELLRECKKHKIRTKVPWRELSEAERGFVIEGEADYGENGKGYENSWYGVKRFFEWLEQNSYKMHVRVFLSRFRSYTTCGECHGTRLQPEALLWKWNGYALPELYLLPISELLALVRDNALQTQPADAPDLAERNILARLGFLEAVGLGYLTLDRASRTLSGGEVERVNLCSCLGTGLVDTLFVLDEPSVGLHARDIDRLVRIMRSLVDNGNTVVVVEHDEAVIRAADWLVEIGPRPGKDGGKLVYSGPAAGIASAKDSITGAYITGRETIPLPQRRHIEVGKGAWLLIEGASANNIRNLDLRLPLRRFVALAGVSGSGKSTLLDSVVYQGLMASMGRSVENPASIARIASDEEFSDIVLVDQGPISRTPRSNAALFCEAWDPIRALFAGTPEAKASGWTSSHFSFNAGTGRCPHCEGLGYEKVEMQFMADLYVRCPFCEGRRFTPETLAIKWRGKSLDEVLEMNVSEALAFFDDRPAVREKLKPLEDVGLGYLPLGQPLNTLSGGEAQRIKLVSYMAQMSGKGSLLLLDEPTTGLHRHDVRRLLDVLQRLVDRGHSLLLIEHHADVLKSADWLVEMGPEAGAAGGRVVFEGTPELLAVRGGTVSAPYIREAIECRHAPEVIEETQLQPVSTMPTALTIGGARQNNLKNISLEIPLGEWTVVTGVSGSGKSSLAFDIVFAEGQRRFMESMSAWARQYVEQLPRPDVDWVRGIPPTVAIEQRVTQPSGKSTVATVTEVAQYLRLLYARIGIQHSPRTGEPLVAMSAAALHDRLNNFCKERETTLIMAQLIRGRKGHHEPLANWARKHGYRTMRIDGKMVQLDSFRKLDRFREHDIELVIASAKGGAFSDEQGQPIEAAALVALAIKTGKGAFFCANEAGKTLSWFSTSRADPLTGEAFPELDPKHFSWNSARGHCPVCMGHGALHEWMREDERFDKLPAAFNDGQICPDCGGARLNAVSRAVYLHGAGGKWSLPELLAMTPSALLSTLRKLEPDAKGRAVLAELLPEIEQRLHFMDEVGLGYLSLDRAANTLSGGESQRIRLAAQLGARLSGVLYVLDEPSIGLHARDTLRLINSLKGLKALGNTLLVVEHDPDVMRAADTVIDLGPGAGVHGGEIIGIGHCEELAKVPDSLTGRYLAQGIRHPHEGAHHALPPLWKPRSRRKDWLVLEGARLRNLKGIDLHVPLGRLTVVCGISGAGKSTLVRDLLAPAVTIACREGKATLRGADCAVSLGGRRGEKPFDTLLNGEGFRSVIEVDQSPIGKTPRSTPATYIGAFDMIRGFFGALPEAKMRGLSAGSFSFNTPGGRCETCKGSGLVKLEMAFMPDTYAPCEDCGGSRYGADLSDIRWNGRNIGEVLDMSFEEAAQFFDFHDKLHGMLDLMVQCGLGYLKLGQQSPTLSGGEAQRLKMVSELAKGLPGVAERRGARPAKNLYILEEPTIGLHLSDCERLIDLLHRMVEQGHTVVVIEHHLDIIAEADWLVEIGPEGGEAGGEIVYQGPVEGLKNCKSSPTAPFLSEVLD
ncbi:MAG: excinuclease ABC subunit UvrA [Opitutales bacterium]|nr:excinuclease ABC subunit UvrA [Opitutales bacterium]